MELTTSRTSVTAALLICAAGFLALGACGPNVSGYCPTGTPGEGVVAQSADGPPPDPVASAAPADAQAPVALAKSDGGAEGGAAAVTAAAAGPFDITGVVKSGTVPGKFAVVYLVDAPKDPARGMTVNIDQRMMLFIPYVAAVAVGGSATFVNSDPFPHNVFSPNGDRFDLGTLSKGGVARHAFKSPGAYTLLCNVHPGMIGYIYVAPSSYFAVANAQGQYTIKAVPAGDYKISAWSPKMGAAPVPVSVRGGPAKVDIEITRQ